MIAPALSCSCSCSCSYSNAVSDRVRARARARARGEIWMLRDNPMYRLGSLDPHKLLVEAAVEVGQPVRVQSHLVQDGGVEVLDVERVLHGPAAQLVRLAHADPAFDPTAGHPHREAVAVVV